MAEIGTPPPEETQKKGIKLVIAGPSNAGKTRLLSTLDKDAFIISNDGKTFPFAIPHVHLKNYAHSPSVTAGEMFLGMLTAAMVGYKKQYKKYPTTVVLDSISKIFIDIVTAVSIGTVEGYGRFTETGISISAVLEYIESELINKGINVILITHSTYNEKEGKYVLVGGIGDFKSKGGIVSETDSSIQLVPTATGVTIYHRSYIYTLARTLNSDLPESLAYDEYNLQDHMNLLIASSGKSTAFEIEI